MSLVVEKLNAFYGASHILHDVSLHVGEGEIVSLLGRNGAGKTTTLLSVMGYLAPRPGSIRFQGREIGGLASHRVSRLGIGFVPQERGIFKSLTVEENLLVAARRAWPRAGPFRTSIACFPVLRSDARSAAPSCRAANSRCSRLHGLCCSIHNS